MTRLYGSAAPVRSVREILWNLTEGLQEAVKAIERARLVPILPDRTGAADKVEAIASPLFKASKLATELPKDHRFREKAIQDITVALQCISLSTVGLREAKRYGRQEEADFIGFQAMRNLISYGAKPLVLLVNESSRELVAETERELREHEDESPKSAEQAKTPKRKIRQRQPDNVDVRDLCKLLEQNRDKLKSGAKTEIGVAREFTDEPVDNCQKAANLLRQARRYRHLWKHIL